MRIIAALAVALTVSSPAFAADKIKVAVTGPFSGGSANMGTSMRDAAKLAVAELNAAGGIDVGGKKMLIEVIERDDQGNNDVGGKVAQEVSEIPELSGVIGTVNTGIALAGDKYYQEKGITKIIVPAAGTGSMTPWTQGGGVKDLFIFRFSLNDGIQSAMVVEEAVNRGYKKVAILTDSTNYGVSGSRDLFKQIKKQGDKLEVVSADTFNIGDKEMSAQVKRAKEKGAEAVLIWGIGPELAAVANSMAAAELKVPLIGGWPLSMSSFLDNAKGNADGAVMPQAAFFEDGVNPRWKKFIDAFHKAYKVERIPSAMAAAEGYDAMLLFAAAVKQAKSADSQKIKEALEDLKEPVKGVIATWRHPFSKWDPANVETHEAFRREHGIMGTVKDGKVVFANKADRQKIASRGALTE
ncbi:MAG: ABC transporter substrate-binding protein [Elusimicrobia bacterium]|nr:ABC transporter substrate-binding protein [Elusimicrobiota bacterium]